MPPSVSESDGAYALFEALDANAVTALSFVTDEAKYVFRCADAERVSVNGQKADHDVFATLLKQVLTMPVVAIDAFTPPKQSTVTLTLSLDGAKHVVYFYRDDDLKNPYIMLISGESSAPVYHKTDAWRVGTMLLTCEGTRIQDERGRETPVSFY